MKDTIKSQPSFSLAISSKNYSLINKNERDQTKDKFQLMDNLLLNPEALEAFKKKAIEENPYLDEKEFNPNLNNIKSRYLIK